MSRKITAARRRHIATISSVLELAERTERKLDAEGPGDDFHGLLGTVAGEIVDAWVGCAERWSSHEHGWTSAGIRAFVLAYATHAPDDELADAAATACRARDWCLGYVIATRHRNMTGRELQGVDLEALARASRGEMTKAPIAPDDTATAEVH